MCTSSKGNVLQSADHSFCSKPGRLPIKCNLQTENGRFKFIFVKKCIFARKLQIKYDYFRIMNITTNHSDSSVDNTAIF